MKSIKKYSRYLSSITLLLALSACISPRSTEGPMAFIEDKIDCPVRPKTLIVFMPGVREVPADIVREGFVKAVRDRRIQADMQILDSHYGFFTKLEIVDRLEKEVMLPAREKGYSQIWFTGISLGGFGTLIYGASQAKLASPDPKKMYDGFFVMAPYMGEPKVWEPIQSTGLKNWKGSEVNTEKADFSTDLWRWLGRYTLANTEALPQAYIGYGTEDRLAPPNKIFGSILPTSRHLQEPGGHDWPPWKALWARWLDSAPLAKAASADQLCIASN
jgi:hypothetical protein